MAATRTQWKRACIGLNGVLGNCCHRSQQRQTAEEQRVLPRISEWLNVCLERGFKG